MDHFSIVFNCLITQTELTNWKKIHLLLNYEQVMVYFCFCNKKNDLEMTRVTNPYISLAVVKLFGLEGESFRQEGHVYF